MIRRLRAILVVVAAVLVTTPLLPALPAAAESELVCPGTANIPVGWIHSDSFSIYNVCGVTGPVPHTVITQWEITRHTDRYRDDTLQMCIDSGVVIPVGWTEIATSVVWYRCGLQTPAPGAAPNVRIIKCLNCPVRPPDPPTPTTTIGGLDGVANTGVVAGWAQDPGRPGTSLTVHYYIDGPAGVGVFAGAFVADQRRTDIQPGNHGMRFTLPAEWFDARMHTLYAYGIDATNDPPVLLSGSPKLFILPKRPIGSFEGIDTAGNANGWTLDPSLLGYANPNAVDFYIDGFFVARVPANGPRPDITTSLGYPGDHGFRWPIPPDYRDGSAHTLVARGTDLTGDEGRELPGSPRTFTLQRRAAAVDLDGDHRSDVTVWRPGDGVWWSLPAAGPTAVAWGMAGDKPVAGDYNGDGTTDRAVYRAGLWCILITGTNENRFVSFGLPDDKPVPGDYDGDGKTDLAVFRPSDTTWYVLPSGGGSYYGFAYGLATDRPVPGDYDGDGKTDVAVYRPLVGAWIVHQSSDNTDSYLQFGVSSDKVVPADYDGDGRTDRAVFRPSNGTWHIMQSIDGRYRSEAYGMNGDVVSPADYDGDGRVDLGVFRPANGTWYLRQSRDGDYSVGFGLGTDLPVVYPS
ncbi:hypothetical protein F4553_000333 [Allocatelliglobosispora scoriae]|uniref:VCBS repeat-containing protein n=1 Tax=Allocatelliglobosispora scoriae TaxID=643052 RepID=A0A841BF84_9ACTN|nr:VCBS repeat-containing protein [Allocatelliglobosispora scoriae]MBB5866954.1 hypothetical protein [Allocatelliglobosispora scoriae]